MVARLRPDPAGIQPVSAPAGANGHPPPDEQGLRPAVDAVRFPEAAPPSLDPVEAQLVAAVQAVLAAPGIEPERVVRVLGAATTMALAAGADDHSAIAPLLAAMDVLDADLEMLLRLIDEGDDRALPATARLARRRAHDLGEVLQRDREALERLDLAPRARAAVLRAPGLARLVGKLAEEVETTFAVPAAELPPGSLTIDADEVRRLIATTGAEELAGMITPGLPLPAAVAGASDCGEALGALETWLERPEPEPAPLPQPRALQVEPIDVVPDFVELAAQALTWLASLGDATLDRWVIGGTWAQASARMAAAVEAWSRWGPAGDRTLAADLDPRPQLEVVGRDEVAVTTWTAIRQPVGESEAEGQAEAGAQAEEPDPRADPEAGAQAEEPEARAEAEAEAEARAKDEEEPTR
jgi:hypothetical protein